jgi:hypothetical protein
MIKRIYDVCHKDYLEAEKIAASMGLQIKSGTFRAFNDGRSILSFEESYKKRFAIYSKTYNETIADKKAISQAIKDDIKFQKYFRILSEAKKIRSKID